MGGWEVDVKKRTWLSEEYSSLVIGTMSPEKYFPPGLEM